MSAQATPTKNVDVEERPLSKFDQAIKRFELESAISEKDLAKREKVLFDENVRDSDNEETDSNESDGSDGSDESDEEVSDESEDETSEESENDDEEEEIEVSIEVEKSGESEAELSNESDDSDGSEESDDSDGSDDSDDNDDSEDSDGSEESDESEESVYGYGEKIEEMKKELEEANKKRQQEQNYCGYESDESVYGRYERPIYQTHVALETEFVNGIGYHVDDYHDTLYSINPAHHNVVLNTAIANAKGTLAQAEELLRSLKEA